MGGALRRLRQVLPVKLEDEETGDVAYTNIACRLLDLGTCRCGNYPLRRQLVRGCVVLDRDNLEEVLTWMPRTCAYRLVHEGRELEAVAPAGLGRSRRASTGPGFRCAGGWWRNTRSREEDWQDFVIEEDIGDVVRVRQYRAARRPR